MSEFEKALSYVHDVLRDLQSGGATPTAPLSFLAKLAAAGGSATAPVLKADPPPAGSATATAAFRVSSTPASPNLQRPAADSLAPGKPSSRPRPSVPVLPPLPPFVPSTPTAGSKTERLLALRKAAESAATTIDLVRFSHPNLAFGSGSAEAQVLFIGEAPGEDEALDRDPLETEAGDILKKMLKAMELPPEEIFISFVLRVRTEKRARASEHRQPTAAERQAGLQRLQEQIAIIQPRVLVALGAAAVEGLLGITDPIGNVRSQWLDYRGTPLLATYSPAYLARNQAMAKKREVWSDMLLVLEKLGRPISEKQRGFFLSKRGDDGTP